MRQVFSKRDHSFNSVYSAITLVIIFVLYLAIGGLVHYLFGPKIADSLILNGPFFIFLLSVVSLSLIVSLIKNLRLRKRSWDFHFAHLGLITIFAATIVSTFVSKRGHVELKEDSEVKFAKLDQYQAQIRERSTGKTLYIDLNLSIRPQGLNLDFGPIYLISYLPYSEKYHANLKSPGDNSAVILKDSRYLSGVNSELVYLSSNRTDYSSEIKNSDLSIIVLNQAMLECIEDLSIINPNCSIFMRRKSIEQLKKELCITNKYVVREDGFYSLGNDCKMQKAKIVIEGEGFKYRLKKYLKDTGLKLEYRYSSNFENRDSDILKYYEKGNTQNIYQMKLGETREIIDHDGRLFDLKFHNKEFKLPFDIRLNKVIKQDDKPLNRYMLLIDGKEHFIDPAQRKISKDGWIFRLDKSSVFHPDKIKIDILFDPTRIYKIIGAVFFLLSFLAMGVRRITAKMSK